jgi:hypothetical protein
MNKTKQGQGTSIPKVVGSIPTVCRAYYVDIHSE